MRHFAIATLLMLALLSGCERERRDFRQPTGSAATADTGVEQSPLHPGGQPPLKAGESESAANACPGVTFSGFLTFISSERAGATVGGNCPLIERT